MCAEHEQFTMYIHLLLCQGRDLNKASVCLHKKHELLHLYISSLLREFIFLHVLRQMEGLCGLTSLY